MEHEHAAIGSIFSFVNIDCVDCILVIGTCDIQQSKVFTKPKGVETAVKPSVT